MRSNSSLTMIIDERELLDRLDGDTDLLAELVPLFLDDYPLLLEEIRSAIEKTDLEQLRRAAHTLKGTVSNFSAYLAYEAAR